MLNRTAPVPIRRKFIQAEEDVWRFLFASRWVSVVPSGVELD